MVMTLKSSSLKLHTAAIGTEKLSQIQINKSTVLAKVWRTLIRKKKRTPEALRLKAEYNSEMPVHVESCYPDTHLSLHHRQWLATEVIYSVSPINRAFQ